MRLSEAELRTIVNALHVASVQYIADANIVDDATLAGDRLRDAFKMQSADALAIASKITGEIG